MANLFTLTGELAVNANPFNIAIIKGSQLVNELAGDIKDLAVDAVKLGGKFEQTANSVAVFSGSLTSAKRELGEVDDLARNTVGLRLESAEEGYQRLRALGFESKRAKSLIKELGEEKILSGADDDALKRVFFNFTQIASGGQKISQEIRELLTAMPSLKRAFLDAFGTLDPKKIQSIVESNPDAFFDKLTAAMQKNKAAAGGLDDATGKLEDAWTEAKRAFAEPLLPELTEDVKSLTNYIQSNKDSWREWGEYVVNIIKGIKAEAQNLNSGGNGSQINDSAAGIGLKAGLDTLSVFGLIRKEFGFYEQKGKEAEARKAEIAEMLRGKGSSLNSDLLSPTQQKVEIAWGELENEHRADNAALEEKRIRDEEIARQKEIKNLQTWKSAKDSIFDSFYSGQEAKLSSYLTNTVGEEKKQITDLANLRANRFKSETSQTNAFYNRLVTLANSDKDEIQKIESDKAKELAKLNADFVKDSYATQKKLAEIERDSYNDRLKEAISFKRLLVDELTFDLDTRQFNFGETLKQSFLPQSEAFDEMIRLTNQSYAEVLRITRESYNDQINEIGISEERKTGIRKEAALAERKLAEQNRRDVLRIEEDKKNRLAQYYADLYGAVASGEQQKAQRKSTFLESVFGISTLSSSELDRTASLIKAKTNEISKAQEDYRKADNKRLDAEIESLKYEEYINNRRKEFTKDRTGTVLSLQPDEITKQAALKQAVIETAEESANLYVQLESLRGGISDYYEDFGSFRNLLTQNLGDETIFDQINAKMLEMEKNASLTSLDLKIQQARQVATASPGDPKAQFNLDSLLNERGNLTAEYFRKEQEQRAKSISGLREYISLLQNGDPVATAVIQHQNLTNALREQAAAQEALVGKWSFSIDEVNAKLMSAAAGQQGLNDTLVNGILGVSNALESAVMQWDGTLSGFFESMSSAFADMVKQMIAEMIRLLVIATAVGIITAIGGGSFSEGFGSVIKKDKEGGGLFGGLFGKMGGSKSGGSIGGVSHELGHSFSDGGFTGNGGINEMAGVVHGKEFVFNAQATRAIGVNNLAAMQSSRSLLSTSPQSVSNNSKTIAPTINVHMSFPNVQNTRDSDFRLSMNQQAAQAAQLIGKKLTEMS